MKRMMIAALVAAQFSAAAGPAQAADLPREEMATPQRGVEQADAADGRSGPSAEERVELSLAAAQAPDAGPAPARTADAQEEDEPKKGKSTGDKVLTGAAVVLGVAAVAVAGLLVAIFVN